MSGRIVVSHHAVTRARERFGRSFTKKQVASEVTAALAEDRVACKPPSEYGAVTRGRRLRAHQGGRYCWTPNRRRCYVIQERRGDGVRAPAGEKLLVVITSLSPWSRSQAA